MTTRSTRARQAATATIAANIKAEITLHYDGPKGEVWCGYRVRDIEDDELLAMGAFPVSVPGVQERQLADVIHWVDQLARTHLGPF